MADIYKLQGTVEINTGKSEASLKRVDADARRTRGSLDTLGGSAKKAGDNIGRGFDHGQSSASRLHGAVNSLQNKLNNLKVPKLDFGGGSGGGGLLSSIGNIAGGNLLSGAISGAITKVGSALKEGWSAGIEYNKMLENTTVRLNRFFETAKQTDNFVASIERFAADSPIFEMKEAATGAQRLLQMKFAANEVVPALSAIGDIVGGVGGGKEEIDRVTLALSQMVSKGKLMSEEMQQLAEAGVPAWELLSKAIRRSEADTHKLVEAGRIDATGGVKAIIAAGGSTFKGQSDRAGQTLSGREAQFNSALDMQLGKATQANFGQLKNAYTKATEGFSTGAANDFSKEVNSMLGALGNDATGVLNDLASGKYFSQGADAISKGRQASEAFNKGETGKALNLGGQSVGRAVGLEYGAKGEDKVADSIAKSISGDGIDKKIFGAVVQGVTAALQAVEPFAQKAGQMLGAKTGGSVEGGVRESLDMHSPSRVMVDLGMNAAQSFVDAFGGTLEAGKGKVSKSPIDVEAMKKALRDDLEKLLADPKIKAMLDTIAKAEGTGAAYNMKFGGGRFSDLSDHPNDPVTRTMGGKSITSTAAGRYQFLNRTWGGLEDQLGLKDFSAHSQDLGAVQLMKQRGMIGKIQSGDIAGALTAGNREWASLPGSPYGQPTKKAEELTTAYNAALEKYNGAMSTASGLLDGFTAKIESFSKTAMAYFGGGAMAATIAAPSLPKVVAPPAPARPGDGASARPFAGTILDGGGASVMVKAGQEALKLSDDLVTTTTAFSGAQVPLKAIPGDAGATTAALKATGGELQDFSYIIKSAGKTWAEAAADYQQAAELQLSGGEKFKRFHQLSDQIGQDFDDFIDAAMEGRAKFSDLGKSVFKDVFKGLMKEAFLGASGGKYSSPGQAIGGAIGGLFRGAFGGQGGGNTAAAGSGAGGGSAASGGGSASGGGPSVSGAIDTAKSIGGALKPGGLLSKIPGMGKLGGFLGKIPGLSKLGGLFGMGGGGAAAGAAGAGGAAAGSGGLLAAAGGPIGIGIMAATMIGVPLLKKLFTHNYEADFKKLIKGEYGVDASKQMIAKVMQIGQSKFGTEWQHREIETVRLPEVRDMLSEYAGAFGKGGNGKLFDSRMISDQFNADNRFKVGLRANGGPVMAGMPYIVGERRPELFIPSTSGRIESSVPGGQRGGGHGWGFPPEIQAVLEDMRDHLSRLKESSPGAVYEMGQRQRPGLAAQEVEDKMHRDHEYRGRMRDRVATR